METTTAHTQPPAAGEAAPKHEVTGFCAKFGDGYIAEIAVDNMTVGYGFGLTMREATEVAELDTARLNAHAGLVEALKAAKIALETGRTDLDSCVCTGINDTLRNVIDAALAAAKQ